MPNILTAERRRAITDEAGRGSYFGLSLDDLRREPGRLVFLHDLALMGLVRSYDAAQRLVSAGKLPAPYRIGSRAAWEARDVLKMIGASEAVPADQGRPPGNQEGLAPHLGYQP
jgi:hypothetical protein